MLEGYTDLLSVGPAVAMTISDFRNRTISLRWLIMFSAFFWLSAVMNKGLDICLRNLILNIAITLYMGAAMAVYARLKSRRWIDWLKKSVGAGDMLFVICLTPMWDAYGFTYFLIGSMFFSILWWIGASGFGSKSVTIPLVGTSGIILIALLLYKTFTNI